MEIITGRTGTDHVYAADDAELYRMFIGSGDYVFRTGNQFNATMYGAYTIRVSDGSLMTQGRLAKIRPTSGYDELQFDVGVTGYRRADLVVAEYRKTVTTHEEEVEREGETTVIEVADEFENVSLVVLKGANNTGTYITPTYATGDIDRGEVHQVPLWEVRFNGVNFESLIDRRMFLDGVPYDTLIAHSQAIYAQANARVDDALAQTESRLADFNKMLTNELERLRTTIDVAPLTRLSYENRYTTGSTIGLSKWVNLNTAGSSTITIEPFTSIKTSSKIWVWFRLKGVNNFRYVVFDYGTATSKTVEGVTVSYDGAVTFTAGVSASSTFDKWSLNWSENGTTYILMIKDTDLVGYEFNLDDVLIVYLNGLRLLPTKYAVRYNVRTPKIGECEIYLFGVNERVKYNEVEIEVWRPSQDEAQLLPGGGTAIE